MKITDVFEQQKAFIVETNEDKYYEYTRYSKDCWFVRIGESLEPLYDCEEIEKEFQKYETKENNAFYCFDCGGKLKEKSLGFLYCSNCRTVFLPYEDEDGNQCLKNVMNNLFKD
jgi:ribosomal protein L37AE/L43A